MRSNTRTRRNTYVKCGSKLETKSFAAALDMQDTIHAFRDVLSRDHVLHHFGALLQETGTKSGKLSGDFSQFSWISTFRNASSYETNKRSVRNCTSPYPRAFELLKTSLIQFPPRGAKKPFKCPTLSAEFALDLTTLRSTSQIIYA